MEDNKAPPPGHNGRLKLASICICKRNSHKLKRYKVVMVLVYWLCFYSSMKIIFMAPGRIGEYFVFIEDPHWQKGVNGGLLQTIWEPFFHTQLFLFRIIAHIYTQYKFLIKVSIAKLSVINFYSILNKFFDFFVRFGYKTFFSLIYNVCIESVLYWIQGGIIELFNWLYIWYCFCLISSFPEWYYVGKFYWLLMAV